MIYDINASFDFLKLQLANPVPLYDGSFLSKITIDRQPLCVYLPKCGTKHGIVTHAHKKYIDFHFELASSVSPWIHTLEETLQKCIYEKRDTWFVTEELELDDIQHSFIPSLKKKDDTYVLRCYFPSKLSDQLLIYNEHEIPLSETEVNPNSTLMSIVEIVGVKFNTKCFQVMIHVNQMMIVKKNPPACLIHNVKEEVEPVHIKITDSEKISLKTPREVYENAMKVAKAKMEEANHAKFVAEELRQTYGFFEK
jgi:hypothetical protein